MRRQDLDCRPHQRFAFVATGNVAGNSDRVSAIVLTGVSLFHILWVVFTRPGWLNFLALLPRPHDVTDLWKMLKVFAGRSKELPRSVRLSTRLSLTSL